MPNTTLLPEALSLPDDRTLVMGVVNVTPDSFSDGGDWFDPEAAVQHGLDLVAEGADLVDVGGESTRPGAERVAAAEEWRRVGPVIEALVAAGVTVSVDTMRAGTAAAAVAAGATLVNDVSGGTADARMLAQVAELGVGYVSMHARGPSVDMAQRAHYGDVVAEVVAELRSGMDRALAAGVAPSLLVLDPGIGFAKTAAHNWTLLAGLDAVLELGPPVLVGVSRKRFLGQLLADDVAGEPRPREARQRDDASVALTALLAARGVWAVRTHTARAHRDAVEVVAELARH